jgi:mRNA interferase RelE/StbE
MNAPGGAATQVCSPQFDRRFFSLPAETQRHLQRKIDELGRNLRGCSHHRMQGVDAFRMRVGDFRIIYNFSVEKNELILIAVGNRRDIYKSLSN